MTLMPYQLVFVMHGILPAWLVGPVEKAASRPCAYWLVGWFNGADYKVAGILSRVPDQGGESVHTDCIPPAITLPIIGKDKQKSQLGRCAACYPSGCERVVHL
jgi:hypothetical protein